MTPDCPLLSFLREAWACVARLHLEAAVAQGGREWLWEMAGEATSDTVGQLAPGGAAPGEVRPAGEGAGRMASFSWGVPSESGRRWGSVHRLCVKGSHCHSTKSTVCFRTHSGEYTPCGFGQIHTTCVPRDSTEGFRGPECPLCSPVRPSSPRTPAATGLFIFSVVNAPSRMLEVESHSMSPFGVGRRHLVLGMSGSPVRFHGLIPRFSLVRSDTPLSVVRLKGILVAAECGG